MKDIYYHADKLLSYDCLFNMIVGERGNGKTYDFKKRGINRYLRNKGQFFYLRRTQTELNMALDTFFDDVAIEFPNYEFKVQKNHFFIREAVPEDEENNLPWEIMGHAGYLSSALRAKSVSYSQVSLMAFDEFLIPGYGVNRYMPDEVNLFLNFYETVSRMRDVTVLFISNAMSLINPYFLYFGAIFKKPPKGFVRLTKEIVIEFTDSQEYRAKKKATRFGQLVSGTEFERNAFDNQFETSSFEDIKKKEPNCSYMMTLTYNDKSMGVYMSKDGMRLYISFGYDKDFPVGYSFVDASSFRRKYKTKVREIRLQFLIEVLRHDNMYFEDSNVKACFYNFLKNIL